MLSEFHFTSITKNGNPLHYTIQIKPEEIIKDEDCDFIIRRVIADSAQFTKKLPSSDLHITITSFDTTRDKIDYQIVEEPNQALHEIAFKQFKKDQAIDEIHSKQIQPDDKLAADSGEFSLLERFAVVEEKPRGFFAKLKQVLAVFFAKLLYPFYLLQQLWNALTGQSAKQLKWDLNLLAEICGTPPVNGMTMAQSLQYMSTMLDREQEETADPELQIRFQKGLKTTKEIEKLRQNFSESKALSLVKEIQKEIKDVGDKKVLIPVGYMANNKLVEALLEVSKEPNGQYRVAFISAQEETRSLFDREAGIDVSSQSIRREITGINLEELLATIPTLVELQTSARGNDDTWRSIFLQTLRFEKSKVEVNETTQLHRGQAAPGRLGEVIAYVKGERASPEEANRFDLAIRLKLFLDICKGNKKGLKDLQFWTNVRTTARYLATQIEAEKKLLGSRTEQGIELTRIYGELKQLLDELDRTPPVLVNLRDQPLSLATGRVDVVTHTSTPSLTTIKISPSVYPKVDPPFSVLDPQKPVESIQNWGIRCRKMITLGKPEEAAREAKLMVQMMKLPEPLKEQDALLILPALNDIGEAIARGAVEKEQSTLDDIEAMVILSHHAYLTGAKAHVGTADALAYLTQGAKKIATDLLECHLSPSERNKLLAIRDNIAEPSFYYYPTINSVNNPQMIPLLNIAKFTEMTLKGTEASALTQSNDPLIFNLKGDVTLEGNNSYRSSLNIDYKTPLPLRAPLYASNITQDITNRYLSEFCCLGCIRDNCENYNKIDKKDHRFHPLYMLHNYVDTFCEKLTKKGDLTRDEITDLMYTQQTNQNANTVFFSAHGASHGFAIANGFDENDRQIQFMNTCMIYLDHPHFFKMPDLRWQFETKLFKFGALSSMLDPHKIKQYQPFFNSMINKLKKELTIANSVGDKETAGYLIHICGEFEETIKESSLSEEQKNSLIALLPQDTKLILNNWARELVGKNDDNLISSQLMVFPLVLQSYYNKLIENSSDPIFDQDEHLELILSMTAKIESNDKLKKMIDPEMRDRYQSLLSLVLPKTKEKISHEAVQGDFVNKILLHLNPAVSSLRLRWDPVDFPTFLALDPQGEFYQFDLLNGKLSFQALQTGEVPNNVKHQPGMEKIFGSALNESWKIEGSAPGSKEKVVAYTHEKFPNYRIVVKRGSSDSPHQTPEIFIERLISKSFGRKEWITYSNFDTLSRINDRVKFSTSPDLPVHVALALGDRTYWADRNKKYLYVYDLDGEKPYAILKLTSSKVMNIETQKKETITEIEDVHLLESNVHLLQANKKELEQFASIEDPDYIQVVGKNKKATQISFTRYEIASSGAPLTYDIGKKGITSPAYPNYLLAANGVRPGSADPMLGVTPLPATFDGFHLLQKDGDEKVLIPLRGYEQEYTITGDPLPTSKIVFSEGYDKCPLFEYSVNPETNRLVAASGDAYAYLAYISLAHSDYSAAAYYLSKARTTAGYDISYDQIFTLVEKWNDETPNGLAMKLRFELFREKVLEDRQIHQIKEGKLGDAEALSIQQIPRLITLANLFEKYQASRGEIDPSLALTPGEDKEVERHLRSLLASHGDQPIQTNEPDPVRAQEVPLQTFTATGATHPLGIHPATVMLWAFNGTEQNRTPFTVKDPRWVLQNFRTLFNEIMTDPVNSVHYKQTKLQLRLLGEQPAKNLNTVEKAGVEQAQSYLLKLMNLKESDPAAFDTLKRGLGPDQKLPPFKGPFFNASRMKALARMNALFSDTTFDQFSLHVPDRAKDQAEAILESEERDPYDTRSIAKGTIRLVDQWKANPQGPFKDHMRKYLMNEVFGAPGTECLDLMTKAFKLLDPVEIKQPDQTMVNPAAKVLKPSITYAEKYQNLLDVGPADDLSRIDELEREIASRPEPPPRILVRTESSKIHTVMGDQLVDTISRHFTKSQVPPPVIDQSLFDKLRQSDEKAYVRMGEKHRADLAAYLSAKTTVTITKGETITLMKELKAEQERLSQTEKTLKRDLLQYVELLETPAGILAMRRLVGKGVKPSLDFLIALWQRGETEKGWEDHPLRKLGMKEIPETALKKLDDDIAKYLEIATTRIHLNRVVEMGDNYLKSCGKDNSSLGESQLANELFEGIQSKRNYSLNSQDNADYRDLLYEEYSLKIIMYADQIQTLREMEFDPNAVRQLKMGRGKTEVVMPKLAKKKATGKNHVVLMLPEELFEANCRSLDIKNRLLFGQEMHRFEFGLKTDKSPAALQKIRLRILQTIKEKGFTMTTKRSILSLKNTYVLLLNKLEKLQPNDDKTELIAQIREMSKIYSLFYDQSDILADEIDDCLNVRKEVNFALGEAVTIDQIKGDVGAELMNLVLDQEDPAAPLYKLRDAILHNTQAAISPEEKEGNLKDLVRLYYDQHQGQIVPVTKEDFVSYIMNDPAGAATERWVFAQKETNNPLFKQITTVKGFIDRLNTTLGRVGNVNFGRDPISGVETIPFSGSKRPSLNSEFDDDIERICFSYLDYLQEGVSYKQVYQIVARMYNQALAEMRGADAGEFMSILDTQATRDFEEFKRSIDPEGKLGASISLVSLNDPKMIEALVKTLNDYPKGRLAFCHKQVVGNMKLFSAQINSMSTEAPQISKNFGGFTGYPWNIHTYHDKVNATRNIGVDGMTWALMLGRNVEIKTFALDPENPIDSLLDKLEVVGNYQGVIDAGAYLRGTSNQDFIDKAFDRAEKQGAAVNAGIYFDESGKIVKKLKDANRPLPIEIAPSTDMMTNLTLYDRFVGADVKQGKKAKAIVTIGENTFIRDLFQAVWRLRQLHQEQTVVLAVSDAIKNRILGGENRELTMEDICQFCLMNESRREAEDNYRAEKEKIQGFAKRELLPEIVSCVNNEASDDLIIQMAKTFASHDANLFIKQRLREEAYDDYGKMKTKEDPLDSFERLKAKEKTKSDQIGAAFQRMGLAESAAKFTTIGETVAARPNPPADWFLNKVDTTAGAGGEVEQEAQAEVEQAMELMVQTETQTQTEKEKEVNIPIVQSGEAGHGDVSPLESGDLSTLVVQSRAREDKFRKLRYGVKYFDDNVYCSAVFERNLGRSSALVSPQSLFYSNRKPIKQVMIAKAPDGEWTMVIPTTHEAHGACREFIKNQSVRAIEVDAVVVSVSPGKSLMMYKTGEDRTDALPFTSDEDKENFYRLYVQAKVYNGEIEFGSKEEQDALKKWLLSLESPKDFKEYFEQNILAAKPRRFATAYAKSSLFKVFTEVTEEAALN